MSNRSLPYRNLVEYTPQAYVPGDMDMFFQVYAPEQVGRRPEFISVDGGEFNNHMCRELDTLSFKRRQPKSILRF